MKIVLFTCSELPVIGGREIVVHYLAKIFKQMGHQVRVTGPAGCWTKRHRKFPYPVHRWPTLRGYLKDQVYFTQIALDIMLFGADVIHAHDTIPTGFAACKLKKFKNIPVILTPHGEDIHVIPEIHFGLRLNPHLLPKIQYAAQHADVLTAISSNVKTSLIETGADPDKIVMIPNGTDAQRYENIVDVDVRKWLHIEKDAQVILSVGNYHHRKGYEILLEAMHEVLKELPLARLIIVGRDQNHKLAGLIDRYSLQGKVIYTGLIRLPKKIMGISNNGQLPNDPDLLSALYQSADVYVSSGISDGAEGLSLAVLDGLAAKLPVIATNISGNKDIVKNGKSGILVEPGNAHEMAQAMVCLLKNPVMAKEFGKTGYEISRQYHWNAVAMKYMEVYRKAITRSKQYA